MWGGNASISFYEQTHPRQRFMFLISPFISQQFCHLCPSISGHFKLSIPGKNNQKRHLMV